MIWNSCHSRWGPYLFEFLSVPASYALLHCSCPSLVSACLCEISLKKWNTSHFSSVAGPPVASSQLVPAPPGSSASSLLSHALRDLSGQLGWDFPLVPGHVLLSGGVDTWVIFSNGLYSFSFISFLATLMVLWGPTLQCRSFPNSISQGWSSTTALAHQKSCCFCSFFFLVFFYRFLGASSSTARWYVFVNVSALNSGYLHDALDPLSNRARDFSLLLVVPWSTTPASRHIHSDVADMLMFSSCAEVRQEPGFEFPPPVLFCFLLLQSLFCLFPPEYNAMIVFEELPGNVCRYRHILSISSAFPFSRSNCNPVTLLKPPIAPCD